MLRAQLMADDPARFEDDDEEEEEREAAPATAANGTKQ